MNCEDIKPDGQPNGRRLYHADELRKGAPAWPYYGGTPTTDRIFAQITPTLEGLDRALEREFFVRAELAQLAPVQDEPWPAYRAYVRATFGCEPPECYAIQRHWPSTAPASWQSMAIGLSGKLLYGWLYDSSSIFRGFDHGYYDSSSIFRGFDHGYSYYAFDFAGVSSLPLSGFAWRFRCRHQSPGNFFNRRASSSAAGFALVCGGLTTFDAGGPLAFTKRAQPPTSRRGGLQAPRRAVVGRHGQAPGSPPTRCARRRAAHRQARRWRRPGA
jgi:hypothetical protein